MWRAGVRAPVLFAPASRRPLSTRDRRENAGDALCDCRILELLGHTAGVRIAAHQLNDDVLGIIDEEIRDRDAEVDGERVGELGGRTFAAIDYSTDPLLGLFEVSSKLLGGDVA